MKEWASIECFDSLVIIQDKQTPNPEGLGILTRRPQTVIVN